MPKIQKFKKNWKKGPGLVKAMEFSRADAKKYIRPY